MSDRPFRPLRRLRAAAKRQAANDNRTLQQQLQASLALELACLAEAGARQGDREHHWPQDAQRNAAVDKARFADQAIAKLKQRKA
jgi:hypothetical protein